MNDENNNSESIISDEPHDMIKAALARAISTAPDTIARGFESISAAANFPNPGKPFGRSTW